MLLYALCLSGVAPSRTLRFGCRPGAAPPAVESFLKLLDE